jgi:hypothetical protein
VNGSALEGGFATKMCRSSDFGSKVLPRKSRMISLQSVLVLLVLPVLAANLSRQNGISLVATLAHRTKERLRHPPWRNIQEGFVRFYWAERARLQMRLAGSQQHD